jgi:DNA-binding PadR family transcriptional regulator
MMFFIALEDGPAYGYELATRFKEMTKGHMKFSFGTIYPFLRRMERKGEVRSRRDEKTGRVYYELTKRGLKSKKSVMKRAKDYQKEVDEKLLGILAMHAKVFGQKSLSNLLKRARQPN